MHTHACSMLERRCGHWDRVLASRSVPRPSTPTMPACPTPCLTQPTELARKFGGGSGCACVQCSAVESCLLPLPALAVRPPAVTASIVTHVQRTAPALRPACLLLGTCMLPNRRVCRGASPTSSPNLARPSRRMLRQEISRGAAHHSSFHAHRPVQSQIDRRDA